MTLPGGSAGGASLPLYDQANQKPSKWAPRRAPFGSTLEDFAGWVSWADHAYELNLPPCWVLHEGLVHQLSALWHVWRAAYAQPGGGAATPSHGGPAAWHGTYLLPFRDRLQAPDGVPGASCRARDHRGYTRGRQSIAETVSTALAEAPGNGLVDQGDNAHLDELAGQYGPTAAIAVLYE